MLRGIRCVIMAPSRFAILTIAAGMLLLSPIADAAIVYPKPYMHAEAGPVHVALYVAHPENGWRTTETSSSRAGAELSSFISWPRDPPRPGFELKLTGTSEDVLVTHDHYRVEPGRRRPWDECPGQRACEPFIFRVAPASGETTRVVLTFELRGWSDPATGRKDAWRTSFDVVVNFKGEGVPEGSEWKLFTPAVELKPPPTMRAEPGAGVIVGVVATLMAALVVRTVRRVRASGVESGHSGD